MKIQTALFDEQITIHKLRHYLPAQAPLKDFVHHNTLHAFQDETFWKALHQAHSLFGYKVFLSLAEYRNHYNSGRISYEVLVNILTEKAGPEHIGTWIEKLTEKDYDTSVIPRVGLLRANWKSEYHINLDSLVHPKLFRVLNSYLDQGISIWNFPVHHLGFLASLRELERNSFVSIFKGKRARTILLENNKGIKDLLGMLVGDESLYEQYLFDQQFSHQGWSGMVAVLEENPQTLLDTKKISLKEMIFFELLLELDSLEEKFGDRWQPLGKSLKKLPMGIFEEIKDTELQQVFEIWQEAFEWTYYDQVLMAIQIQKHEVHEISHKSFQAVFCIDDRESSIRRHLEILDSNCETFGTPGFFGVEFFYQPYKGKFYTKLCPAPVTPKYLIKEVGNTDNHKKEHGLTRYSHSLLWGYLISHTIGFWSAFRLFFNIISPKMSPATASSFRHMDKFSRLTIENKNIFHKENGLQVGFTIEEMVLRVESVLKSIGMVKDFAGMVYIVGHGSSSTNNPHFAAYDCGACSGRPGSVNARVFCHMANHIKVREQLRERGIDIPASTQFLGGLHDTTRDEIVFFDEKSLSPSNREIHRQNEVLFARALDNNAKERSRRFIYVNSHSGPEKVHEAVKRRAVSLFEPRPELNHATNALCIVGRRELARGIFLDRRAFLNSYHFDLDPDGNYLFNILKAAAPVCGGINLEYFFSRVDNLKLGAGTKLPHNVMGLIGVANGMDGDLRPGLPAQMIEVHDPVRLLMVVEHFPEVVLSTIQRAPETFEWFRNEWVQLVVVNPLTFDLFRFRNGEFVPYEPFSQHIEYVSDLRPILESSTENLPVYLI